MPEHLFVFAWYTVLTKLVARVSAALLLMACSAAAVRATELATPDDTARFLAGLRPSPGSPLEHIDEERGLAKARRSL